MLADSASGRWSGPCSYRSAIEDLQDVLTNGDRAILLKVPANAQFSRRLDTTQEALDYLTIEENANATRSRHGQKDDTADTKDGHADERQNSQRPGTLDSAEVAPKAAPICSWDTRGSD